MKSGISDTNPTIVAAFKAALLHQGLIIALLLVMLSFAWLAARQLRRGSRPGQLWHSSGRMIAEPQARRLLRIGFGVLWVVDGLLQAQPAMAAGLPSQIMAPSAATSPAWVQHLVNWAGTAWAYHPVQAGAAAVWIQVGIGAWLIFAPAGWPSRLAGLVSVGWGLVVWVFAEAFGGIFAPGLTFLFGAPGAVLLYCAAGLMITLPERFWHTGRLGRQLLMVLGLFLAAMAVLQAWPGRGYWQGTSRSGQPGSLTSMVASMSSTPQPAVIASLVRGFASLTARNGFAINLTAVIVLAVTGAALVAGAVLLGDTPLTAKAESGRVRGWLIRPAIVLLIVFCLADWVLIEDFGFFGGLGTDPNSMIPFALLAVAGYLALAGAAVAPAVEPAVEPAASVGVAASVRARTARAVSGAGLRAVLALWAGVVVLVGAAPMALAQADSTASPIIAQAIDGNAAPLNIAAPAFALTDQNGRQVSLASLRGKVVLLTFLDPVCTSDCPLIAQEFRAADQMLGVQAQRVEMVAVVANPVDRSVAYTRAFDSQEGLSGLPNWLFVTGSLTQLASAWRSYGIEVDTTTSGGMIAHNDVAYVIDTAGRARLELNFDPGPGTSSSESSFAAELASSARQFMGHA